MTAGTGGTPERPPGYAPPDQPGVAAGSPNVIRARQVFIVGANGELLVYNPTVALGNLVVSIAGVAGTGLASDTVHPGVTSYSGTGIFAQLFNGGLQVQGAAGQNTPGLFSASGVAGEVAISSGLATGVDSAASVIVDSSVASGVSATSILLQAAQTTLNLTATTVTPSPNVNPGHQSAAPAAYSQSYEQASTNRINQIMDVLVQTGVWHT